VQGLRVFQLLLLLLTPSLNCADETNPPTATPVTWLQETNAQEILRGIVGLGEQLRSNQLAIEQNGNEAREAAARSSEVLSNSLRSIQDSITSQQQALSERSSRELREMQGANRVVVIIVGVFTTAVALTLLLIAYFQWRISKAWTQITHLLPVAHGGGVKALGPGTDPVGLADAPNPGLLHAVEELENRVQDLEHISASAPGARVTANSTPGNGGGTRSNVPVASGPEHRGGPLQAKIVACLSQGQTMLKQNDWEGALQCFDEVLALDPNHGEALVKKGSALERMKKLNEAFECYDRAIAADQSMTVAYLYKGGLCSRLERFKEALECYDKALRTHTD
jgi:hypothetical protein